jgi:hypothetical protein
MFVEAEYFKGKTNRFFSYRLTIAADPVLWRFIGSYGLRAKAAKFAVNLIVNIYMQVTRERKRRQGQDEAKQQRGEAFADRSIHECVLGH